jgi:aryl-alcohol dehydrogenase-like predicted oxidoreductase
MADLVKAGKIRYPGVSNFNVTQLKRAQAIYPVASLQPPYSMLRRGLEGELMDYCAANQIGIVAYSPMAKGLLTDKFTRAWVGTIPEDDHRRNDPNFQEPRLGAHLALVDGLRTLAAHRGRSAAQLAIAWTLRNPALTSAIVGARHPGQIVETAAAGDWNLTAQEIAEVDALLQEHAAAMSKIG